MKFKFECNDDANGTLEFKGNVDYLIDAMAVLGSSIRKLSIDTKFPISGLLFPVIVEASETDGKELYESAEALLVELHNDLSKFCEQIKEDTPPKDEPKYYNGKVVCVKPRLGYTKGKIYEIKDGVIQTDNVGCTQKGFTSLADLNGNKAEFVEVVE